MLPFLKPKVAAGTIIMHRKPTGEKSAEHAETESHPELANHAAKLIDAMHAKDNNSAAEALQAIHEHFTRANSNQKLETGSE